MSTTLPCQRALPIGLGEAPAVRYITDDLRDALLALFLDSPGVIVENISLGGERETDSITVCFIEGDKPMGMLAGKIEVEVRYLSPTGENVIGEVYDAAIEHDKEVCPYCNKDDCYCGCDKSQHDDTLEHEEDVEVLGCRMVTKCLMG